MSDSENNRIRTPFHETLADIAYLSGVAKLYSGDSRADVETFFHWAIEFENHYHKVDWDQHPIDYMDAIELFVQSKIKQFKKESA